MENDVEGDEWVATEFESKDIIPNATNNNFHLLKLKSYPYQTLTDGLKVILRVL